jgi:hypothetical protein
VLRRRPVAFGENAYPARRRATRPAAVGRSYENGLVIVPVYYNAESLPLLFLKLQKVEGQLHEPGYARNLIFVDDGSGDESMIEFIKVKQQRRRRGDMNCIKTFCNSPKVSTVWNAPASGQRAVKVAPCRRL